MKKLRKKKQKQNLEPQTPVVQYGDGNGIPAAYFTIPETGPVTAGEWQDTVKRHLQEDSK